MKITKFENIDGPLLITPNLYMDSRGFFLERYKDQYAIDSNISVKFIQDNFSRSNPGVLRGLHYQFDFPQGKLITVLSGKILDISVDLRTKTDSLGKTIAVELNGDNPQWLWLPAGFAHGFCVLGDKTADVLYKVDNQYSPKGESGIIYNDPLLNIKWPINNPTLNSKDLSLPTFEDYLKSPHF